MYIGLDLDNTLACYDQVFLEEALAQNWLPSNFTGDKATIKASLSEHNWQCLQGRVYGYLMPKAILMPGAEQFLLRCKQAGADCWIISHKTLYGHFDPMQINLREAARHWLVTQGFHDRFGIANERVFFEDSRLAKISRIQTLQLDHFIDDLQEVLADPEFPNHTAKHWFRGDWSAIETAIFGHAT